MAKETSIESLTLLLKGNFPEVVCEAITPKHPDVYTSFKVKILETNFRKAMNPELWPLGACIGRFLDMKTRITHTTK